MFLNQASFCFVADIVFFCEEFHVTLALKKWPALQNWHQPILSSSFLILIAQTRKVKDISICYQIHPRNHCNFISIKLIRRILKTVLESLLIWTCSDAFLIAKHLKKKTFLIKNWVCMLNCVSNIFWYALLLSFTDNLLWW